MVMPPMRTSSNFPFSNTRTSSGSSKRFRTVSSIAITPPRLRQLNAPHAPVQTRDAKCVRRPGNLAKSRLMHAPEHFIRRRKALDRGRQICVWTSHSRKQRSDCGKNFLEIDTIAVPDQAARLSEIEDAAFSAGSKHPRNFTQSRVVVGQVSKTECRCHQIEVSIGKRQPKRGCF